jgi:hypothetical protein
MDSSEGTGMNRLMAHRLSFAVVCGIFGLGGVAAEALAQGAEEGGPVRCINLSRINRTEVIDNRSIAFYLRGGDVYINRLNRACSGLERNKPFSYRTPTNRICSVDFITVLEDFGAGLTPNVSCPLGMFVPADEEEVENLLHPVEGDQPEVTVEEIDVEEREVEETEVEE